MSVGAEVNMFFLKKEKERHERNAALEPWAGAMVESNANETTPLFADGGEHMILANGAWTEHQAETNTRVGDGLSARVRMGKDFVTAHIQDARTRGHI